MREKTNLTLHPAVKESAMALAAAQGRSLSELVERLLERELLKAPSPSTENSLKEEPAYAQPTPYSKPQHSTSYK